MLTIGPTEDTARRAVQRYSSAGTPVFFACDDAEGCGRIACVQADHDMAGRIAAELLSAQLSPAMRYCCARGTRTPSHYRMAAGFEAYLRENSVPLTLVRADGYHDKQELALRLRRTLAEDARISGAFSVSARSSVLLADAVAEMGRAGQVRVVASDLFGETVRNMEEGLVQNVLIRTRRSRDIWLPGSWVISCCAGYSPRPASTTWKAV
ncbi:MAG: substrate-binding domain-containing protein [Ruthenibacterium lactatiformans]